MQVLISRWGGHVHGGWPAAGRRSTLPSTTECALYREHCEALRVWNRPGFALLAQQTHHPQVMTACKLHKGFAHPVKNTHKQAKWFGKATQMYTHAKILVRCWYCSLCCLVWPGLLILTIELLSKYCNINYTQSCLIKEFWSSCVFLVAFKLLNSTVVCIVVVEFVAVLSTL